MEENKFEEFKDNVSKKAKAHKTPLLIAGGIVGGFLLGFAVAKFGPRIVGALSASTKAATLGVTTTAPVVEIGAESIAEAAIEAATTVV